jgi:hypothetical protein
MIVKVIQDLNSSIEFVYQTSKEAHSSQQLDRSHNTTREDGFEPYEPRISNWDSFTINVINGKANTEHNDEMFSLAFDSLSIDTIENLLIRRVVIYFVPCPLGTVVNP